MTTIQEQIKLLQAVADGKALQYQSKNSSSKEWIDVDDFWHQDLVDGRSVLNPLVYNWRIKPEPKVIWINEYPSNNNSIVHLTEGDAKRSATREAVRVAVKYQEVL